MNVDILKSNDEVLAALANADRTSPYVMVAYRLGNGSIKVVDMGYVTGNHDDKPSKKDLKQQFKYGCMRVNDNLLTGHSGYVRDADGTFYRICRASKHAEVVDTNFWFEKATPAAYVRSYVQPGLLADEAGAALFSMQEG